MAIVRPFRALRPVQDKADKVASVPYDVVTAEEARTLAEGNPLSFLHVIRPEIDLPDSTDPYSDEVYKKAKENLGNLVTTGILFQEQEHCFFIYRIQAGSHEQTGLACCCSVSEYDRDIIRKHENTRREKEDDRFKHIYALSAHAGPVLMTYRARQLRETLLQQSASGIPIYDFVADDGVRHTIWREHDVSPISEAFREVPLLYIADGHHRAAGASRVRRAILEKNPGLGEEECNFFLAVLFPSDQLRILPYNRYIGDLNGLNEKGFLEKVIKRFEISETGSPVPEKRRQYCMYLEGKWYTLIPRAEKEVASSDPVSFLDLSLFQEKLLGPVLGIIDQKNDSRIDFVGGEGSTEKLALRVDQEGGVAFSFFPVSVEELLAVADAHMIMPPKSTWFSPKLRSGLLIHKF
jgi:uncharacterized protein (DUF1015 family)